jgi:hypothetical protein
MFRRSTGFQARYHNLTLMVVLDFDQWKVLIQGPGVLIEGGREFDSSAAEMQAQHIAEVYVREEKLDSRPPVPHLKWTPLDPLACLSWQPQAEPAGAEKLPSW